MTQLNLKDVKHSSVVIRVMHITFGKTLFSNIIKIHPKPGQGNKVSKNHVSIYFIKIGRCGYKGIFKKN